LDTSLIIIVSKRQEEVWNVWAIFNEKKVGILVMSKKCYICNSEMAKRITSINTGWGTYKLTVDGVNAYICPQCGEVTIEGKDAVMLQKLSKSLVDVDENQKPDVLNLTEVFDCF